MINNKYKHNKWIETIKNILILQRILIILKKPTLRHVTLRTTLSHDNIITLLLPKSSILFMSFSIFNNIISNVPIIQLNEVKA